MLFSILIGSTELQAQVEKDEFLPSQTVILNDTLIIHKFKKSKDSDSLSAMFTVFSWNSQFETSIQNNVLENYHLKQLDFYDDSLTEFPTVFSSIKSIQYLYINCEKLKNVPTSFIKNQDSLVSIDLHTNTANYNDEIFYQKNYELIGLWTERRYCKLRISQEKNFTTQYFFTDVRLTKQNVSSIVNIKANKVIIFDVNQFRSSIRLLKSCTHITISGKLTNREKKKIKRAIPQAEFLTTD